MEKECPHRPTRLKSTTFIQKRKADQIRTAMPKRDLDSIINERAKNLSGANQQWPFLDPLNTAVITNVRILDGEDWVQYVTYDEEDGAWQFLPSVGLANMKEAAVVGLKRMVQLDSRIKEVADLPYGWHAWRDDENAPWTREPKPAR